VNPSLFQALFEEVEPRPQTVSELNADIKAAVETSFSRVWVEGEIVSFRNVSSGHWYFTLNDGASQIKAVVWKGTLPRIRFVPEDGMNVRIKGRLSFWQTKGELKLQVDSMQPAGEGSLAIAFEQIRARLEGDGLFDESRKRVLPRFPRRIGVVTSRTGAAFPDIVHVLSRRAASISIVLFPTSVQGDGSAGGIVAAIECANRLNVDAGDQEGIDVLIVGRGGGSAEDLWAFNDEGVARAIRASAIPVISAVGHEIDTTIADLAADCRAATPSAAAEIVVQHEDEIVSLLNRSAGGLMNFVGNQVRFHQIAVSDATRRLQTAFSSNHIGAVAALGRSADRLSFNLLERHLQQCRRAVDDAVRRQFAAAVQGIERENAGLEKCMARLDALSPLRVLDRGYSITQTAGGVVINSSAMVRPGDVLGIRLASGRLNATVDSVE